jgi:hypothetical protein
MGGMRDALGMRQMREVSRQRCRSAIAGEQERIRLEQRFLSGADCGWTPVEGSKALYCRHNGRPFRIEQGKDKRRKLVRISSLEDHGSLLGTYLGRGDTNKVLKKLAHEPEPRW